MINRSMLLPDDTLYRPGAEKDILLCASQVAAEADAEVAYARVGALCEAIKAELEKDLRIHNCGILPQFIKLPQVTASEYCRASLSPCRCIGMRN